MGKSDRDVSLVKRIRQLEEDRAHHANAVAEIDAILRRIGEALAADQNQAHLERKSPSKSTIDLPAAPAQHAPPPHLASSHLSRPRGRFAKTAEQSVLDLITAETDPSTAQINAHWRLEGRKGTANVTLLKLMKQGLVQRRIDPAVRGSRYILFSPTSED